MAEKRKVQVEKMDWDDNLDLNTLGDPVSTLPTLPPATVPDIATSST